MDILLEFPQFYTQVRHFLYSVINNFQKIIKWTFATELRNCRKGKIKNNVFYKGKNHEAYISHVKVQITASRKDIYLVLVYGITEHPMMLATNKEIKSKEDVIKVARTYFSRWKIEEYFRCKKQIL